MRVFIVGPLPGTPEHSDDAWKIAENRLIRVGHKPVSMRMWFYKNPDAPIEKINRKIIQEVLESDGIMIMDEANETNGGTLPRLVAAACKIPEVKVTVLGTKW